MPGDPDGGRVAADVAGLAGVDAGGLGTAAVLGAPAVVVGVVAGARAPRRGAPPGPPPAPGPGPRGGARRGPAPPPPPPRGAGSPGLVPPFCIPRAPRA